MRIYCQYTIGGYKIFHLTGFDHSYENGKYVTMAEIRDASESDSQNVIVSGKCECGLDRKIMHFFSNNSVGMILLHNCGSTQEETFLFIRKPSTKTTFAFAATSKEELILLEKIATAWTNGSQDVTEKVLSACVEKPIIDNEVVFAFNEKSWKDFVADVSNLKTFFLFYYFHYFLLISLFRFLIDGKSAFASHLAVLVHHAVDAPFPHGLTVVNMLRTEASVFAENQLYAEKSHADSNY